MSRASLFSRKTKKKGVNIILKKMRMEPDKEKYAGRTYDQYASQYFERAPYPSMVGIKTVLEALAKEDPKAKSADANLFTDPSLLKSVEDSGFIKTLYE